MFALVVIGAGAASFADQAGQGNVDRDLVGAHAWGKPGQSVRQGIYKLDSIPGGPYKTQVGAKVTVDGSASKPKRKIRSYDWSFQSNCPGGVQGQSSSKSGKTAKIVAICDTTATLTVSDGQSRVIDTDSAKIKVKNKLKDIEPKLGKGTKRELMAFSADQGGTYYFGLNRCAREPFDPDVADHWIHKPDDGSDVNTKQVNDPGGPYDGMFYVTAHNLVVERTKYINSKFFENGEVYDLNVDAGRKYREGLQAIVNSTTDHERIHGELVEKALKAKAFKKVMDELAEAVDVSDDALQTRADGIIIGGETVLKDASVESKVQAKLKATYKQKKATIFRPGTPPSEKTYTLANIGDVENEAGPIPPPEGGRK